MKQILMILLALAARQATAQSVWTVQRCMQYAVEHNHEVKQAELQLDNYRVQKTKAVGSFLPYVDAGIGAQYNFGRAIDPETNGYTDVSTFYNGYQLQASLPVFDGFSRLHALKAAKASVFMGQSALRQMQDQTVLSVLQAFVNVAYYDGLVKKAKEKVEETTLLLKQVRVLEEVGRKSAADVAQIASQQAEADYELTRQQNLHASALLELKKAMGYPVSEELKVKSEESFRSEELRVKSEESFGSEELRVKSEESFGSEELRVKSEEFATATGSPLDGTAVTNSSLFTFHSSLKDAEANSSLFTFHPSLQMARYQMEAAKHEWHQTRASLFPTLSLSAGLSTTYFRTLHSETAASFNNQFKNNMGEYIGATLNIPLFNRLQTVTNIRRAKNNYMIAHEAYQQKLLELEKLSREAWQDWLGYLKQTAQMEKKVETDSLAYQLTRRQFEEGLSTAIDLHATGSQLLKSKATLLQCQLMTIVKEQLVRYYRGEMLWTE